MHVIILLYCLVNVVFDLQILYSFVSFFCKYYRIILVCKLAIKLNY
jgi:hypothetical protein